MKTKLNSEQSFAIVFLILWMLLGMESLQIYDFALNLISRKWLLFCLAKAVILILGFIWLRAKKKIVVSEIYAGIFVAAFATGIGIHSLFNHLSLPAPQLLPVSLCSLGFGLPTLAISCLHIRDIPSISDLNRSIAESETRSMNNPAKSDVQGPLTLSEEVKILEDSKAILLELSREDHSLSRGKSVRDSNFRFAMLTLMCISFIALPFTVQQLKPTEAIYLSVFVSAMCLILLTALLFMQRWIRSTSISMDFEWDAELKAIDSRLAELDSFRAEKTDSTG